MDAAQKQCFEILKERSLTQPLTGIDQIYFEYLSDLGETGERIRRVIFTFAMLTVFVYAI